ncbi:hypothetical protein OBCHQ24_15485 [Oceanobacillus iheyensis]|nr:hypothetical protein OBCHQ24_15485 [Oceanobacillus iheyensis]
MRRLIKAIISRKNFILYTFLKASVMLLTLITNIFIVRELSVNDFGTFSIAFMLTGLITSFGFKWSSSSILYFGSKERLEYGNINKTFWSRNIIIAFSLLMMTILFIIFSEEINNYIGQDLAYLVLMWLYVSVIEDYLNQYYLAVKRQILSSMLSITAKVIYILLIITFPLDVKTLIILNIISHATVIAYIFGINKNDIGRFEFDRKWFKEILNFSIWQLFGFSGIYLINFGDVAVIKFFMTTEDVGIYNAAYKLFNAIASFGFVITSYYASSVSSYFASEHRSKVSKFFYRERIFIFSLSTLAHVVVILFSKPIIFTLYGEKYSESVSIFAILMVGSIFRYLSIFYMLFYNTNGKHKIQQIINIFTAVLNLILDIVFINIFGLIGPAIATVTAMFTSLLISFIYCERKIINFIKVR